ncbi:hypothetical protein [Streptomyces acidicola]|uniref:hypothetical protein n=1 Tax=Streptomyces acidicola TaxID=2596892 RepID=UPI003822AA46
MRGDDAIEAVADLLMSPGSLLGLVPSFPALIGVVVRRGIDSTWLAQPPVQAARDDRGRWQIAVPEGSALFLSTPGVREEFASRFGPDPGHTASAA